MSRKVKHIIAAFIIATICTLFLAITMPDSIEYNSKGLVINMDIKTQNDIKTQLYYLTEGQTEYVSSQCKDVKLKASAEYQTLSYKIPVDKIIGIRIDFGETPGYVDIAKLYYFDGYKEQVVGTDVLDTFFKNQIDGIDINDGVMTIKASNTDPYMSGECNIVYTLDRSNSRKLIYCGIAFVIIFIVALSIMKMIIEMARTTWQFRKQIYHLAVNDFKSRYSGSYFGIGWGFLQPISTILLFWFVFQVGLRSQPIDNVPFILWLIAGMIPWNFFSDAWVSGSSTFQNYSYLVKKVVFNIDILPTVKIVSSSILNIIFNGLIILVYTLYGLFPGVHIIDMIYFSLALTAIAYGLSLITATLNVFMKDVGQFLGIVIQFVMWGTPMMWSYTMLPDSMSWFYNLNPLHYIINGYRESLINKHWFFYQYPQMIWFWVLTIALIVVGKKMLKRLKPHFADVL